MKIFQDVILESLRNRAEVLKSQDNEVQSLTDVAAAVNEIATLFAKIAIDMAAHLQNEEEVFFPAIKRADAARVAGHSPDEKDRETIRLTLLTLQREHEEIGDAVHTIRHLSKNYEIPSDVCNTFMVTYQKLKEFEDDLHKHVHLENNILFLKAAQL